MFDRMFGGEKEESFPEEENNSDTPTEEGYMGWKEDDFLNLSYDTVGSEYSVNKINEKDFTDELGRYEGRKFLLKVIKVIDS